ncbi:pectate lyase [Hahella sp. KA22]|uniref:RICIN domain-containing protein n=1 Tax=Hahella sp. KA22 TaxID=1628392 RepID=UPI000FDDB996|nr:RICIN domain-containing protein [Hahella sp. KA22]AZZ92692.1 pectate lyase [Hahella sp. KA22]QAY56066.1 pectate lyase [Hahella sp. KA22]
MNIKTHRISSCLASLSLLTCTLLPSAYVHASNCEAAPVSGKIYTIVNRETGLALDIEKSSPLERASLIQWRSKGSLNQQFRATDVGGNSWKFEAMHSNLALDVLNLAQHDNAELIQWPYWGGDNQKWFLVQSSSGGYSVRARHSGKALTASAKDSGARIVQTSETGSGLQRWYFNPVDGSCHQAKGFAGQRGADGLATTTGGAAGETVVATNCQTLTSALSSDGPKTVVIPANTAIDCRTPVRKVAACAISCPSYQDPGKTFYRVPVGDQTCKELGAPNNATVSVNRNESRIQVKSNKTLLGQGANSRIIGATLNIYGVKNIIINNVAIENVNPHLVEAGDAISIENASHIWVDHIKTKMISDGHIDIKNSANLTLSWNHFDGYNPNVCGNQHHYTMLVQDSQTTIDHNFWDRASGRNPKLYGYNTRAHIYNNYWRNITYFSINASNGAQGLIQNNYFENARYPHWNESGYLNATGNVYAGSSATDEKRDTGDSVFYDVQLYPYDLDNASGLPNLLKAKAGPR